MGVEIEAVELGSVGVEPFDADGTDDQATLADDEEFPAGRLVVTVEVAEIENLDGRFVDEPIFDEDAADESDDAGRVGWRSGLYGQPTVRPRADLREPPPRTARQELPTTTAGFGRSSVVTRRSSRRYVVSSKGRARCIGARLSQITRSPTRQE